MEAWIILIFIYAIFKGCYNCSKKKASEKNNIYEILAYFSTLVLVFSLIIDWKGIIIDPKYLWIILLKAFILVISWLLALYVISKMPMSLYGVLQLSSILFSILIGWIFLKEVITLQVIVGMIIVIVGLILVNKLSEDNNKKKEASLYLIILMLISCLLSSISGFIDKKVLLEISSDNMQLWVSLFSCILYWIVFFFKKQKVNFRAIKDNKWIIAMALVLTIGDKILYIANTMPESKIIIMTIIKQSSAIVAILLGKIVFKEKHIIKKLLCSALIISGIVITII